MLEINQMTISMKMQLRCVTLYTPMNLAKVIHESCYPNRLQHHNCNIIQKHYASTKTESTCKINYVSQQPHNFGFYPLSPLQLYFRESPTWEYIPDIIKAHLLVRSSGKSNFYHV